MAQFLSVIQREITYYATNLLSCKQRFYKSKDWQMNKIAKKKIIVKIRNFN